MQKNSEYQQVTQAIQTLIRELRTPQVREVIEGLVRRNLWKKGNIQGKDPSPTSHPERR